MATTAPAVSTQGTQLCDYCHQKPKFSNHSYCSKTCASQAAALCNHCHKKPKFQNFEYCGKNCAALANPGGKPRAAGASAPQAYGGGAKQGGAGAAGNNNQVAFDPIQLAKLVAQHIPQVQAMLNPSAQAPAPAPQPQIIVNPFANPVGSQVMPAPPPSNNPFLGPAVSFAQNAAYQVQQQQPAGGAGQPQNGAVYPATSSGAHAQAAHLVSSGAQPVAGAAGCALPGCGQPVHVDAQGVTASAYCSMRHREEAVASGYAPACIMCLTMPQSETDYFCSRVCREESLNKLGTFEIDEGADPQ